MADFMQYLRLKNLFGQPDMIGNDLPSQGGITGTLPTFMESQRSDPWGNIQFGPTDPTPMGRTVIPSPQDYDVGNRMRELYTPEHVATDKFNEMVGAYPQFEEPSGKRKIAAAILGSLTDLGTNFGHTRTGVAGRDVFNETTGKNKYYENVTNWKNQIGPVGQAATNERNQNVNERTMAYQTVSQELRQKADEARAQNNEAKTKIAADRAEVYRLKSLMPQHQFDFSGPTVKVANKQTGEVQDTGIATGSLSDADKMALQQENAMAQIGARTQGQIQVEGVRQGGRETLAETRGWKVGTIPDPNDPSKQIGVQYNEITGEIKPIQLGGKNVQGGITKPSAAGSKPDSPSQVRVKQFNAARELANTNPELRAFIKLGTPGSNDFVVTPPSEGMFGHRGPTAAQYKAIQDAIYGGSEPTMMTAHTPGGQAPTEQKPIKQYSASRNQTRISTDGGKTWKVVPGKQ